MLQTLWDPVATLPGPAGTKHAHQNLMAMHACKSEANINRREVTFKCCSGLYTEPQSNKTCQDLRVQCRHLPVQTIILCSAGKESIKELALGSYVWALTLRRTAGYLGKF